MQAVVGALPVRLTAEMELRALRVKGAVVVAREVMLAGRAVQALRAAFKAVAGVVEAPLQTSRQALEVLVALVFAVFTLGKE